MAIELFIMIDDSATEEDIKEIAREAFSSPVVIGVYRERQGFSFSGVAVTHETPGMTQ